MRVPLCLSSFKLPTDGGRLRAVRILGQSFDRGPGLQLDLAAGQCSLAGTLADQSVITAAD